MKRKPPAGLYLMTDGEIVCRDCLDPSTDELEKELLVGDTYADDPCDRCEKLPKVQWDDLTADDLF